MALVLRGVSICVLEAERRPQWSCEAGTSESRESKELGMTPLFITKLHVWRSLST